jgi:GH24 family phage-related lysozyme (muramidase)
MFDKILEILQMDEGFSPTDYADGDGRTIGYGHRRVPGDNVPDVVSLDEAYVLLCKDAQAACREAIQLFPIWPDILPEARRVVLVCLCFQLGAGPMRRDFPQFVKAVNRQDWERASKELLFADGVTCKTWSKYHQQTLLRCERNAEDLRTGRLRVLDAAQLVGKSNGGN